MNDLAAVVAFAAICLAAVILAGYLAHLVTG